MIIVGELINASRKAIAAAIEAQDRSALEKVAMDQARAGATYIDVNAGVFVDKEADHLKWLVELVQEAVEIPCCLDSPDPAALETALSVHGDKYGPAMINSISLEKDRWDRLLPIIAGTDLKVVALCMSDEGMPETADQRLKIAEELIEGLTKNNVALENIFVDPLVQPVATNNRFGVEFLESVERIMTGWPGVHTMCGLSNISYGLPERKFMNQTFMTMAIAKGLDGAIINPLDKRMMGTIVSAEALGGRDDYCMNYLKAFRAKVFEF
jgi:cobalamin-dependent methionine synthase I